ncbi:MAG: hypothetical protein MRK02_12425 [Candidatus Scalindua sp.]|nr:hypothetical protein [Candidatus Scalindua sp.]
MAKSAGLGNDVLPLPSGGGSIKPIDESFKTDLGTGTGSYQISVKCPKGINDFTPNISLKYSTARGNGPFGLGWSIDTTVITRSIDRRLPGFNDADDVFLFEGRELVHTGNNVYMPLVENEFSKITKTNAGWDIKTKTGIQLKLGTAPDAKTVFDDNGVEKVYAWFLKEMIDINGNKIVYTYEQHKRNTYLKQIDYAIYSVAFNYEVRPDSFSSFRTGFEIRTEWLCKSIDLSIVQPAFDPIKSYRFTYAEAPYSKISLLKKAALVSLYLENNTVKEITFPPIEFNYNDFNPLNKKLETFSHKSSAPPPSLLSSDVSLLDFEGTGLQGVIEIANGSARFWPNKGNLQWGQSYSLKDIPLHVDLSEDNLLFADLDGNGTADLLVGSKQTGGYFPNVPGGGWGRKINYRQTPNVPIGSPQTRLLDLDGDNRADMMYSDGKSFYYYFNKGEDGWDEKPLVVKRKLNEEDEPEVNIDDPHIRMADVVGDGRTHLVQIHSGRILYWPNLGNGKWGKAKRIANVPKLPRNYEPSRLFFADIDGSGTMDVIYVDYDRIFYWINQSGNSFSDPIVIAGTPPVANAGIVIADMKGTGTNGILWSYHDGLHNTPAYRYLDICGGKKPYLLNTISSNTGIVTRIEHGSSTEFQNDKTDPKLTEKYFLPFPVTVVKKITVHDRSTNVTSVSNLKYYNGNFDTRSRQFFGFAKAERIDEGDITISANKTVSYFHNTDIDFKGLPYLTLLFGEDGTPESSLPFKSEENVYNTSVVTITPDNRVISFVSRTSVTNKIFERNEEWNEIKKSYKYDSVGNVIEEVKETKWKNDQGMFDQQTLITSTEYAQNQTKWLMAFKSREIIKDNNAKVLQGTMWYYDGPEFTGLPLGQVDKGNIIRERQLAITEAHFNQVYGSIPFNMADIGYIQENNPILGNAFFIDRVKQKVNSFGNPVERINPLALNTKITFDDFHLLPVKVEFSTGLDIKIKYEYKYGSVTSYKNENDVELKYDYDNAGQLIAVFRHDDPADEPYIQYQYDHTLPVRSLTTLTRAEKGGIQHKRIEYFDGLGEKLQIRSEAENNKVVVSGGMERNAKGLVMKEFHPYFSNSLGFSNTDQEDPNIFTLYEYDALGRSISRTNWNNNTYKTEIGLSFRSFYDPLDLKDTQGNNNFNTPKTEWIDAEDRLVTIIERKKNNAHDTRYLYDPLGNRIKITINNSTFAENSFDNLKRRIRSLYRDYGEFTYLYDAMGNLVERKDGKGDIVHNTYDPMSRLKTVRFGGINGNIVEEHEHDSGDSGEENTQGKLMKVKTPFGEVKYSYSKCGCLRSKTRKYAGLSQSLKVEYEQDNLKRYKKIKYPDGFEVSILYNHGGLIDSIPGVVQKIEYGPTGKRTKIKYANNVVTEYTYQKASFWLESIKTTSPNGAVNYQHLKYIYNETGLITQITDNANSPGHLQNNRSFLYDELDQLIQANGSDQNGNYTHDYEYDDLKNLSKYPEKFGNDQILRQNNQKPFQITGIANKPTLFYKYDDAGNLIETPECKMQFDPLNKLIKVTDNNGAVAEYFYDHLGSRVITKITANGNTEILYNFDDIYTIRGNEVNRFIFDENSQVALIRGNGNGVIFHKDHLGSHTAESDLQTGNLINELAYYAFGKASFGVTLSSPHNYNGKKYDVISDLLFFGGRYYLPSLGVFLTPDPYFLERQPEKFFRVPGSLHLYSYVQNNPINLIDTFGLWFGIDDLIAAAIGFGAGILGYIINWAISGGDFSVSEMLMSGLVGAFSLWFTYNTFGLGWFTIASGVAMVVGPAVTGGLDKASMGDSFGERFLGFLSFAIKFARSPITSSAGIVIGAFGTGFGLWNDVEWFKGGVIAFQYDKSSSSFIGVTLGATVNIWQGNTGRSDFLHELYHSRQYTIFGDWFIPGWIVGGIYGMISGAIGGSPDWWACFIAANPSKGYGNPLEAGANSIDPGSVCN